MHSIDDPEFYDTKNEKRCYAQFYLHPVDNAFHKEMTGEDKIDMQPYILIVPPGQNKTEFRGPVQERHKREYPNEWKAFIEQREQQISGVPISSMPGLEATRLQMLRSLNIHTVEQLAELSDANLYNVGPGAVQMRSQARAYLAKTSAETLELRRSNDELKEQLAALSAQVAALTKPVVVEKPRRGRPPAQPTVDGALGGDDEYDEVG